MRKGEWMMVLQWTHNGEITMRVLHFEGADGSYGEFKLEVGIKNTLGEMGWFDISRERGLFTKRTRAQIMEALVSKLGVMALFWKEPATEKPPWE